jgi:hypothetical protein
MRAAAADRLAGVTFGVRACDRFTPNARRRATGLASESATRGEQVIVSSVD